MFFPNIFLLNKKQKFIFLHFKCFRSKQQWVFWVTFFVQGGIHVSMVPSTLEKVKISWYQNQDTLIANRKFKKIYKLICNQQVTKSSDKSAKTCNTVCFVNIIQCLSKCLLYFANVGQWLLILLGFSQFSLVTFSVLEPNFTYSKPLSTYNIPMHTPFQIWPIQHQ
jgi:hypothetical protein